MHYVIRSVLVEPMGRCCLNALIKKYPINLLNAGFACVFYV
jgi:hypothetical protein